MGVYSIKNIFGMTRLLFFKVCVMCIILITAYAASAQNTVGGINAGGVDVDTRPGGIVQEIKRDNNKVIGSRYLNENWTKGSIVLSGGSSINNVLMRYDVERGIIELYKSEDAIKVVNETFIESVSIVSNNKITDDLLLNGKMFFINNVPLTGLVLSGQLNGKYNLITRFNVIKTNSNYVAALDAGKEESVISIHRTVYLADGKSLIEIPGSKKKVIKIFSSDVDTNRIKSFINKNNLNLKKYTDLIFLVNYVNSQVD